jgi:Transposase DDE domain group 1
MTQCLEQLDFGFLLGKQISARFDGGELSSDGGVMLLAEADQRLGLTAALAACVPDPRDPSQTTHEWVTLFGQRIYQIACGYEDADDADELRKDWAFKTALGRRPETDLDLASQPTFSRLENCVSRTSLRRMADVFVAQFVMRYATRRKCRLILDFDATDDATHGQQQFAAFHGYYKEHCYLPLIVTAQVDDGPQELLVMMLRPGNADAAAEAVAILKRLVPRLRQACPQAQLLLRADGGFARPEIYDWCEDEANRVDYEINLPKNSVLQRLAAPQLEAVHARYAETGEWQRRFAEALYQAKDWPQARRVVIKAEVTVTDNGDTRDNPRFVVTNLTAGQAQAIYEHYGDRGEMENRIKELKNQLQMDRTSCHRFVANQLRVWLHGAAYLLHCELRRQLHGTPLAAAQVETLQRKLLKVAVRIRETARRIWLHFSSSYPWPELWPLLLGRLRAAPT